MAEEELIESLLSKLKNLPQNTRNSVITKLQERLQNESKDKPSSAIEDSNIVLESLDLGNVSANETVECSKFCAVQLEGFQGNVMKLIGSTENVIRDNNEAILNVTESPITLQTSLPNKRGRKPIHRPPKNDSGVVVEVITPSRTPRSRNVPSWYQSYADVPDFLSFVRAVNNFNASESNENNGLENNDSKNISIEETNSLRKCKENNNVTNKQETLLKPNVLLVENVRNQNNSGEINIISEAMLPESNISENDAQKDIQEEEIPLRLKRKRGRKKRLDVNDKTCKICNRVFVTSSYLQIHMRTHTGERPFTCHICSKSFTQSSALAVHLKRHEGKRDFQCPECDYKCFAKIDLFRHMPKHTGARIFICEQCGKLFSTDVRLKEHVRYVHDRKEKHICDICGFVTHRADGLRRHCIIKHTDNEIFKCPICGELVKQRWTYIVHLRRHTGERPHICPECGKGFKSTSQVTIHRRIHREGEFECPDCKHKFRTKHHLIRHSVIHTGAKPYSCMYCSYSCNVKGNINKHMKSVHKLVSFSFKKLNKEHQEKLNPRDVDEESASKRGSEVAEDFLKRISLRKEENLTVEELQRQIPKVTSNDEIPVIKQNCKSRLTPNKKAKILKMDANTEKETLSLIQKMAEEEQSTSVVPESVMLEEICQVEEAIEETETQKIINVVTTEEINSEKDLLYLSLKECLNQQELTLTSETTEETAVALELACNEVVSGSSDAPLIYVIQVVKPTNESQ